MSRLRRPDSTRELASAPQKENAQKRGVPAMEQPNYEALRTRLHAVEGRLRFVVVAWLLSVVVVMLFGVGVQRAASQSDVLRARRIEVVDSTGRPRIVLALSPQDGSPGLVLLNEAGRIRVSLALLPGGASGLVLSDGAGRERISLSVLPSGASGLALLDAAGGTRAMFTLLPSDGSPGLVLFDAAGRVLFRAP
jgi:hypothetical protein